MTVQIHSTALSQGLNEFGIDLQSWTGNRLDGLDLLQKYPILKKSLEGHQRTHRSPGPRETRTINDLTILVDGFLDNPEIFKSYGFESLLNNDYLDHDLWRKWQSQNSTINKQLGYLEQTYYTIDDFLQSDLGCEDVQADQTLCSDDTQHPIPRPPRRTFNHQQQRSILSEDFQQNSVVRGLFKSKFWERKRLIPSHMIRGLGGIGKAALCAQILGTLLSDKRGQPPQIYGTPLSYIQDNASKLFNKHSDSGPERAQMNSHIESLRRLHSNFGKEHLRIVQNSQSADLTPRKEWAVGLHHHHRKSWKAGMRALRRLCNGGTPRRLNEVIPFIALTRAMAETAEIQTGLLSDFDQNLRSWITIFQDDVVKRTLFADAVEDIWGIDLHSFVMNPTGDEEIPEQTLERLQILAKEFVEKANSVFGLDGETHFAGLSVARLRWQQKYPDGRPPNSYAFGEEFAHVEDHAASSLPHWLGNTPFRERRKLARAETCDGSQESIPLLLLTSVAFACAILFLLSKFVVIHFVEFY